MPLEDFGIRYRGRPNDLDKLEMKSQGYVTMPVAGRILNRRPEVVRRWVIDGRLPFREYKGYRYVERDACERIAKLDNRPPLTIYE